MESYEQKLIDALTSISECIKEENSHWSRIIGGMAAEAQTRFTGDTDLDARYSFVKYVESMYGGMGTFNDTYIPEECEALNTELYSTIQEVLRYYWRDLGREWLDYRSFEIIPEGTKVKLIPGKNAYYDRDDSQDVLSEADEATNQVWTVLECSGPDITNMPYYLIQSGDTFRAARHVALQIIH